jgi:hypothetical protein
MVSFSANWFLIPFRGAAVASSDIAQKILIGIAVTATLLGARALAADLEGRALPPVPYSNWSGPHIGIGITAR